MPEFRGLHCVLLSEYHSCDSLGRPQSVLAIWVPATQDSDNRILLVSDSDQSNIVHFVSTRHGPEEKFEPDID